MKRLMGCSFFVTVVCGFLISCSHGLQSVQGVVATPNSTSIALMWEPVSGATGYAVYLDSQSCVCPTMYQRQIATEGIGTTINELTAGTTYYIVVAATSLYGFSLGPMSEVIGVMVTGTAASPLPVITMISASPAVAASGTPILFAATASDSDGDTLNYTWLVDGVVVAGPTDNLSQYTWTAGSTGMHTVEVQVTDGLTTVTATTVVVVTA